MRQKTSEEVPELLSDFLSAIERNPTIGPAHISIYVALIHYWMEHQYQSPFAAYSSEIMQTAKVMTRYTYLKCMADLNKYGYIKYERSFKRNAASKIYISLKED